MDRRSANVYYVFKFYAYNIYVNLPNIVFTFIRFLYYNILIETKEFVTMTSPYEVIKKLNACEEPLDQFDLTNLFAYLLNEINTLNHKVYKLENYVESLESQIFNVANLPSCDNS